MPTDNNLYSLMLEFNLRDNASPQLNIIDESLAKIEKGISETAVAAMGSLAKVTMQMASSLNTVAGQLNSINASTTNAVKPTQTIADAQADTQVSLTDESKTLRDKMLKTWLEIIDVLEEKCDLIDDEMRLIEEEEKQVKRVKEQFGFWGVQIEAARRQLAGAAADLININRIVKESVEITEQFKNANFRLYGSQVELASAANRTAAQYGLLRKEAVEAMVALGNLKVPRDALEKLAVTTAQFSRATGAGIQETARWQKMLIATTGDLVTAERMTSYMAMAMRKYGLDTKDVTALMRTQEEQASRLRIVFGAQVTQEMHRAQIALAAFGKDLGMADGVATKMAASLGTMESWRLELLANAAGLTSKEIRTAEGQMKAFTMEAYKMSQQLAKASNQMEREQILMMAQGVYGKELGDSIGQMAVQFEASSGRIKSMDDALREASKTMNTTADDAQHLSDVFHESNQTLSRQWAMLKEAIGGIIGAIWSLIEPVLIKVVSLFVFLAQKVAWVTQKLHELIGTLGDTGEVIKWITGIILALVIGWKIYTTVVGLATTTTTVASRAVAGLGSMVTGLLTAVANGLKAFTGLVGPMLALSALLLSFAAAVFVVAKSVEMIARLGPEGVFVLITLVGAMIALIAAFTMAAKVLGPVGAMVILALGAALIMLSVAVYILAKALEILLPLAPQFLDASFRIMIGCGFLVAAGAIMAYGSTLLIAGGVMLIAAAGVLLGAGIMLMIAAALTESGLEDLEKSGNLIAKLGQQFSDGGNGLFQGSQMMASAASTLRGAGLDLDRVADDLEDQLDKLAKAGRGAGWAAFMLMRAGWMLGDGAGSLRLAAVELNTTALMLREPARSLVEEAYWLLISGTWMLAASDMLESSGLRLERASTLLAESSDRFMAVSFASNSVLWGARNLLDAASVLLEAATALHDPAVQINESGMMLAEAMTGLAEAASRLATIGTDIRAASVNVAMIRRIGADLIVGAHGIMIGSTLLAISVDQLWPSAHRLAGALWTITNASTAFMSAMSGLRLALSQPLSLVLTQFADDAAVAADRLFVVLEAIANRLDQYGERFAAHAAVISESLRKSVPSLGSFLINFLPVLPEAGGGNDKIGRRDAASSFAEREHQAEVRKLQKQQADKLGAIDEQMKKLNALMEAVIAKKLGSDKMAETLETIGTLLSTTLPELISALQSAAFTSGFNNWNS